MNNLSPINARLSTAVSDFHDARRKASMESLLAFLRGRSADLMSYDEVRQRLNAIESARRTLEDIPLDQIVGSVNRYTDFSRSFLPRNVSDAERWASVKMGTEKQMGLPPIEAYKIGDLYFVKDGHHRVSVARELGQPSIEGYVTPVYSRVPLSPGDSPDDLIIKSEYTDFLAATHLDDLRPDANLLVTAPGQYQKLLEHINVHKYFMDEKTHQESPFTKAVTDWYDTVYLPVAQLIRERNLLRDFPGRSEADLYLWIMDYRSQISGGQLGWEVSPEKVASDLARRYSPTPQRVIPRLGHMITNLLVPSALEAGPEPGVWRSEHQAPHRGDHMFDNMVVTVPSGPGGQPAVKLAIEVARREEARLTGLHIVKDPAMADTPEVQAMREAFTHQCAEADIAGRLLVETGRAADILCARSPWVDLIVFRLNYPPPNQPLARLRSGARTIIRRCSAPTLAVPDAPIRLGSALLAYGPGRKADEALFVATYLAGRWQIPLTVVTVKTEQIERAQAAANTAVYIPSPIERARTYLESHDVQATFVEVDKDGEMDAAQAVLLNAEDHAADFIIMGGYESSPLRESLFGSTVDRVLRSTRRPVLICR